MKARILFSPWLRVWTALTSTWPGTLALLLLLAIPRGSAGITSQITDLTLQNYTGYLIASDTLNAAPGYDRDHVAARGRVTFTKTAGADLNYEYTLRFFLRDEAGVAQPLSNGTDHVDDAQVVTFTAVEPLGAQKLVVFDASLTPSGLVNPYVSYRVEVQLLRRLTGTALPPGVLGAGQTRQEEFRRFIQFDQLISQDAAYHVVPILTGGLYFQDFVVNTDPQNDHFALNLDVEVHRYDGFAEPAENTPIRFRFSVQLRDSLTEEVIPLADSSIDTTNSIPSVLVANPRKPTVTQYHPRIEFRPADGQQLDPRRDYIVRVTVNHFSAPGLAIPTLGNSAELKSQQLLQFNGRLLFGPVITTFKSIANAPQNLETTTTGVRSTLAVDGGSGVVQTDASYTYGDGTPLSVRLQPDGDAEFLSGTVIPNQGSLGKLQVGTVSVTVKNLRLTPTGAVADLAARLPAGLGYRLQPNQRYADSLVNFFNVPLNADLDPAPTTLERAGPLWGIEESKPFWFEATKLVWELGTSTFRFPAAGGVKYVRADEYAALDALPVPAQERRKPSNDLYWRYVNGVQSADVRVKADADRGALLDASVSFGDGAILAHRPLNAVVQWSKGGSLRIAQDLIVPADSTLESALAVFVPYDPNCPDAECGNPAPVEILSMIPTEDRLRFTPDGGLVAPGTLSPGKGLKWGWISKLGRFAYLTEDFTNAAFAMSGVFLRGDQAGGLDPADRPGVLLHTGVQATQASVVERPGTAAYKLGAADYPGLNLRVQAEPGKRAESVIAGKYSGPYPLTQRVKYYARQGGVSGIHEAFNGSFPTNLTLYGYPFQFTTYGLAFLDSDNVDSRTDGAVAVPFPSDFTQDFQHLRLDCLGGLESADLPKGQSDALKVLKFWQADFVTQQLNFERKAADFCDPDQGFLTLGVKSWAGGIPEPIFGTLGFFPSGNLITSADCAKPDGPLDLPFDSRLKLPTQFGLPAPKDGKYAATPVNDAYLSDHRANTNGVGYLNLAVKLDVPLFEDLQVHVHTSAKKEDPAPLIFFMGGWPDAGFGSADANFFTQNPFDAGNRGFPAVEGLTLEQYRGGVPNNQAKYRVRAQRTWLERVHFDYPLKWNGATKQFDGVEPKSIELFVLSVMHQLKHLDHQSAEIAFGAQYDGFPVHNLANFAFEKLEGYEDVFAGLVSTEVIRNGNLALEELLSTQHDDLFKGAFDKSLPGPFTDLYAALADNWNPAARNWKVPVKGVIAPFFKPDGSVRRGFLKTVEGSEGLPLILAEVNQRLGKVRSMIGQIRKVTKVAGSGDHVEFGDMAVRGAKKYAKKTDDPVFAQEVENLVEKTGPALDEISQACQNLDDLLKALEDQLKVVGQISGELESEVKKVEGKLNQAFALMEQDVLDWSNTVKIGVDDPFANAQPSVLTGQLRQKCEDRFHGSVAAEISQRVFKQRFYDLDARIRSAIDSAFGELNGVLREALAPIFSAIDQRVEEFIGEDVGKTLGAAEVKGFAHIKGDSINLLRLDAKLELNVSDKMKLAGFLQVKELNSENTAAECLPSTGKATEVTAGAKDVSLEWAYPGLRVNFDGKFVLENLPGSTALRGMGAGFALAGPLKFGSQFTINELGASMMFGAEENYFSAAAAMTVGKGFGAKGGMMFGRTCSLLPFYWDTDIQKVIGEPPFTGAYAYGEFTIPINELIGIKSTCFFTLKATVGSGLGFFTEGPTYVAKMKLGVAGEVLCIVNVSGEIVLVGVTSPKGPHLLGSGKLEGTLGYCPIYCFKFKKTASMEYENGKWSRNVQ